VGIAPRPRMHRLITPWDYQHVNPCGVLPTAGGVIAATAGAGCFSYDAHGRAPSFWLSGWRPKPTRGGLPLPTTRAGDVALLRYASNRTTPTLAMPYPCCCYRAIISPARRTVSVCGKECGGWCANAPAAPKHPPPDQGRAAHQGRARNRVKPRVPAAHWRPARDGGEQRGSGQSCKRPSASGSSVS
jgi:hypothetical protein